MSAPASFDAIILGAGGAGLMCAAVAAQRGRRVLVVDHAPEPGRKILISGGGRCNFTNLGAAPDRYLSANPHFARSALARYTAQDFLGLVEKHRIAWHEKTLGQLFCDGSARQIVRMLLDECAGRDRSLLRRHPPRSTIDSTRLPVAAGESEADAPALCDRHGCPVHPQARRNRLRL
jgi:predicted flavoprotein YhiN